VKINKYASISSDGKINIQNPIQAPSLPNVNIPDAQELVKKFIPKPITIPPAKTIVQKVGNGMLKATMTIHPEAGPHIQRQTAKAQYFIDSEVLRYCSPLVPFDTGMLDKSGTLGTEIGSGEVRYIAPYAAMQYYNTAESRPYDAQRGAKWFERMKLQHKEDILDGAQKIMKK
jgi:hypothetical protein